MEIPGMLLMKKQPGVTQSGGRRGGGAAFTVGALFCH